MSELERVLPGVERLTGQRCPSVHLSVCLSDLRVNPLKSLSVKTNVFVILNYFTPFQK